MKKAKTMYKLLLIVAVCATLPLSAATISIVPSTLTTSVGQTFSVDVDVTGVTDLYGYQFDLGFDPSILAADSVTEGSFLTGGGSTIFLPGTIDNVGGTVTFNADILATAISGVSGSGTLATFNFTAKGVGSSPIGIFNLIALNSFGEGLTLSTSGATETVTSAAAVPEPTTSAAVFLGIGLVILFSRRRLQRG